MRIFGIITVIVGLLSGPIAFADNLSEADSCLRMWNYPEALGLYTKAFNEEGLPVSGNNALNAAVAAAKCDSIEMALTFLRSAQSADPDWCSELISASELLEDCRLNSKWPTIGDENERRIERLHPEYDLPMRRKLLAIYNADQDVRGRIIVSSRTNPDDKEGRAQLWQLMQHQDSIHSGEVTAILDEYGWIPSAKVGSANLALFFVIQHSALDIIERYLPMFEKAATAGDLPGDLYAKMLDRQLMYSGKPQIYGTQSCWSPDLGKMVLWKLEEKEAVNERRRSMNLPPLPAEVL